MSESADPMTRIEGRLSEAIYVDGKVHKYPLADIWRVTEDYGTHTTRHQGG